MNHSLLTYIRIDVFAIVTRDGNSVGARRSFHKSGRIPLHTWALLRSLIMQKCKGKTTLSETRYERQFPEADCYVLAHIPKVRYDSREGERERDGCNRDNNRSLDPPLSALPGFFRFFSLLSRIFLVLLISALSGLIDSVIVCRLFAKNIWSAKKQKER